MGIEAKHEYRFRFLKSEEWKSIRAETLVKFGAKCYLCDKEDFFNDIHHVRYPRQWTKLEGSELVVLCRKCHEAIHQLAHIVGSSEPAVQWKLIRTIKEKNLRLNPLKPESIRSISKKAEKEADECPSIRTKNHRCVVCKAKNFQIRNIFSCWPHLGKKQSFMLELCDNCILLANQAFVGLSVTSDREAFMAFEAFSSKGKFRVDTIGQWSI